MKRALLLLVLVATNITATAESKPNIVLIFADDLGWKDVVFQSANGWGKKERDNPKGIYSLTEAACQFMEKNRNRPFFVYLSHYAIHAGLQARRSTLEKFEAKKEARELAVDPLYAACTYDLDDGVGILLKKLGELGLDQNTLVVFTSDNGGTRQALQEPLRGNKGCYYEGGIREPFIVRWPGVTRSGSVILKDHWKLHLFHEEWQLDGGRSKLAVNEERGRRWR